MGEWVNGGMCEWVNEGVGSTYRYEEEAAYQGRESKYTCTRGDHVRLLPSCARLLV